MPANRLAFRLEADFPADQIPPALRADRTESAAQTLPPIAQDFEARRKDDALIRTVPSPDGQRALALYLAGDTPEGDFRVDIYAIDGTFLANVMPANLTGAFPLTPAWSADGATIGFIAYESQSARAARERGETRGGNSPDPSATVMPIMAPVAAYSTEQLYTCDRDGRNLRPLTTRDGLVYFNFEISPDNRFVAALACKEDELAAALDQGFPPMGRPRIIALAGGERLLDDRQTGVLPAWSPDGTKLATAFDTDVLIYDAVAAPYTNAPTAAALPLREPLLAASRRLDQAQNQNAKNQNATGNQNAAPDQDAGDASPLSFNPVTRLVWVEPDALLAETSFLRLYRDAPPIKRYARWHVIRLSPQAS